MSQTLDVHAGGSEEHNEHEPPDFLVFGADKNIDPLTDIDRQLRRSSFFLQASLQEQGRTTRKIEAYLTGLLELLIDKGVLDPVELGDSVSRKHEQAAKDEAEKRESGNGIHEWPSVVIREDAPDLSDEPKMPVNCAERMHICHAVCCQLRFSLSSEEIEAGKVKWDLGHPYVIRHSEEGFCVHNDRASGGCGVYEDRPKVCRRYSCADDGRIWSDFENMVLNENFLRGRLGEDAFGFEPGTAASPPGAMPVRFTTKADASSAS